MLGDHIRARAAWAQLKATQPSIADDPETFFEQLGYAPDLRVKAVAHLRKAGLIARGA